MVVGFGGQRGLFQKGEAEVDGNRQLDTGDQAGFGAFAADVGKTGFNAGDKVKYVKVKGATIVTGKIRGEDVTIHDLNANGAFNDFGDTLSLRSGNVDPKLLALIQSASAFGADHPLNPVNCFFILS